MERSVRLVVTFAGAAATAAYATWATSLQPFTVSALCAMTAGGLAAVSVGRSIDRRRPCPPLTERRIGASGWLVLAVALASWQLAAYLQLPRSRHPTLSSLANGVLGNHPVRALAMTAWLGIGTWLARR